MNEKKEKKNCLFFLLIMFYLGVSKQEPFGAWNEGKFSTFSPNNFFIFSISFATVSFRVRWEAEHGWRRRCRPDQVDRSLVEIARRSLAPLRSPSRPRSPAEKEASRFAPPSPLPPARRRVRRCGRDSSRSSGTASIRSDWFKFAFYFTRRQQITLFATADCGALCK